MNSFSTAGELGDKRREHTSTRWTDTEFICDLTEMKPGEPPGQKAFAMAFDPPSATDAKSIEELACEDQQNLRGDLP